MLWDYNISSVGLDIAARLVTEVLISLPPASDNRLAHQLSTLKVGRSSGRAWLSDIGFCWRVSIARRSSRSAADEPRRLTLLWHVPIMRCESGTDAGAALFFASGVSNGARRDTEGAGASAPARRWQGEVPRSLPLPVWRDAWQWRVSRWTPWLVLTTPTAIRASVHIHSQARRPCSRERRGDPPHAVPEDHESAPVPSTERARRGRSPARRLCRPAPTADRRAPRRPGSRPGAAPTTAAKPTAAAAPTTAAAPRAPTAAAKPTTAAAPTPRPPPLPPPAGRLEQAQLHGPDLRPQDRLHRPTDRRRQDLRRVDQERASTGGRRGQRGRREDHRLDHADDKNDATEAVNAANKMITQDQVKAIVGSVTSKVHDPGRATPRTRTRSSWSPRPRPTRR